jgi:hypothetical protein
VAREHLRDIAPGLLVRAIALLEDLPWTLDVLVGLIPNDVDRLPGEVFPKSDREAFAPSAEKVAAQARALVAEYREGL